MLLKLPASSGKTGAMRAGITGTELMNGGKSGSRSGDLDISGGYETVKCHQACDCTALRNGTNKPESSFAQWNRYNPPAAPCLRRGKGQPLLEEKEEPL